MMRKLCTTFFVLILIPLVACRLSGGPREGAVDTNATGTAIAGQVVAQLTVTAAAAPTATSLPATATPVPTPTNTRVVTPTDTPTPIPAPTDTPVPAPTATPVPAPTATPVPEEAATPTPEPAGESLPWTEAIGKPGFAPGQSLGYYLWIDEGSNRIHLRCVTLGGGRLFTGVIKGDAPIRNLNRSRQEGLDVTVREDLNQVDFSWTTAGGPDGLDFDFKGNRLVFHLRMDRQPAAGFVYLGAGSRQVSELPLELYR